MSNSTASTLATPANADSSRTGMFSGENLGPYDAECSDAACAYCAGPETD